MPTSHDKDPLEQGHTQNDGRCAKYDFDARAEFVCDAWKRAVMESRGNAKNYRPASGSRRCGNCAHWVGPKRTLKDKPDPVPYSDKPLGYASNTMGWGSAGGWQSSGFAAFQEAVQPFKMSFDVATNLLSEDRRAHRMAEQYARNLAAELDTKEGAIHLEEGRNEALAMYCGHSLSTEGKHARLVLEFEVYPSRYTDDETAADMVQSKVFLDRAIVLAESRSTWSRMIIDDVRITFEECVD